MTDITTRQDLELLMGQFYTSLLEDPEIRPIFTEIAKIDLTTHLPIIVDFWEQALFGKGTYRNNTLAIHQQLNQKAQLTTQNFKTWLSCFDTTVDANFKGPMAEKIKTRALSIATVMQIKIHS